MKRFCVVLLILAFLLTGCSDLSSNTSVTTTFIDSTPEPLPEESIITTENTTYETTTGTLESSLTNSENYPIETTDTDESVVSDLTETAKSNITEITTVIPVTSLSESSVSVTESETEETVSTTESTVMLVAEKTTTASKADEKTSPAVVITPKATGKKVESNEKAEIDYSNAAEGYMMCRYFGEKKVSKMLVDAPNDVRYTYDLNTDGKFEVFTFTEGNGTYTVSICEQVTDKYAIALKFDIEVKLKSDKSPFLIPDQYVSYTAKSKAVTFGEELCAGEKTDLEKVDAVYTWVVENVVYDKTFATTSDKAYIPSVDKAITKKKGICSDYSATITAILRSQQIPTKLVVGYAGEIYHAWISVYTKESGWIEGLIYFDGKSWHRLDPTFAASNNSSQKIIDYIEKDSNYTAKFIY